MKKISVFLLFAIAVTVLFTSVSVHGDEVNKTEYIPSVAFECSEDGEPFDGFELPDDAKALTDPAAKPFSIGGKGGSIVKYGDTPHYRTVLPYAINYLSLTYELAEAEDTVEEDSDQNTEDTVEDENKDKDEEKGILIDGAFVFGIYIAGSGDAGNADVSVTFTDIDGGRTVSRCSVRIGKPYTVCVDSDGIGKAVKSAELVVTHGGLAENSLIVTTSLPVSSSSADLRFLNENNIMSIVSHEGGFSLDGGRLTLGTDASDVLLDVVPNEEGTDGSAVVYASFGCIEGEGTVTAVTDDSGHSDSSHSIFPGDGLTLVRTVRNGTSPLQFRFRSGTGAKLVIDSFSFSSTDELPSAKGSFTTLTFKDGILSATGKLSMDTVNSYPDAKVGLFTVPVNAKGDPVLLDEIKMTSRFNFSVSLDKYPHAHTDNVFYVALIAGDEVTPVTKSRFVSAKSVSVPDGSIRALHGANPISVFESGVPTILMDVDLSRLIKNASSASTTISRGGYIYGINSEYLRQLDSDMSFYGSIGVSVYIKLICTKDVHSSMSSTFLTYGGTSDGELMIRADDREALNVYPAVVSFLSQRYGNIASYVISSGVNSKELTGMSPRHLWDSVTDVALIARLVYGSAAEYLPEVTVTIPLVLSERTVYAPAETFACLLGERFLSMGDLPWCIMYTADGESPSVLCENMKSTSRANGVSSPLYYSVIYNAEDADGDSTSDYEKYCDACTSSSVKTVFLSVAKLTEDLSRESYSALKNSDGKESFLYTADAETEKLLDGITGSASIHDFTDTYSPEGWNAGYGMLSLQSASVFGESTHRTLRCITDGSYPAGIFLCSFKAPLDLSNAPFAEFEFALKAAEGTQIVFVFGGGSQRAEFTLSSAEIYEGDDGMLHAVCDLSGFASAEEIGYVAVIVYSGESVTMELSRVNVHSRSLDSQGVSEAVKGGSGENEEKIFSPELFVAGGVGILMLLLISTRIITLLSRHDASNAEKERERRSTSKKRRF